MSYDLQPHHLRIINQIFELEKKLAAKSDSPSLLRHIERVKEAFAEMGMVIINPEGEAYSETRTDCTASISGTELKNLVITSVIKPIVYEQKNGARQLIQKGVVVVESK